MSSSHVQVASSLASANDRGFDQSWWTTALVLTTFFLLVILIEFSCNRKVRYIPSRLMVARAIFNYLACLVVLIAINHQEIISANHTRCHTQAAIFLFSLYMATIYYALICWELYLTLVNPFRAPTSGSPIFHIIVVIVSVTVVSLLSAFNAFDYRKDFHICFLMETEKINITNLIVIYIPVFGIVLGGLVALVWSVRRLKSTIIDETYELKWTLIRQQTAIITLFTINYILQAISWSILFYFNAPAGTDHPKPERNPYFITIFCVIAVVFDVITWLVRKYIKQIYKLRLVSGFSRLNTRPKQPTMRRRSSEKIKNISDALRKEVITCIIDGLAKTITGPDMSTRKSTGSELLSINGDNKKNGLGPMSGLLKKPNKGNKKYHHGRYSSISDELEEPLDIGTANKEYELGSWKKGRGGSRVPQPGDYPIKIDGKVRHDVIEQYDINPRRGRKQSLVMTKKRNEVIFTDYGPIVFSYLRRNVYGISDEDYYESILPGGGDASRISLDLCAKFSEGRSGAFFFFTKDMKYLIKTLTKSEAQLLLDTLRKYVNYMKENPKTYLSKYFGLHSIKLYGHNIYFVVNKNIFSTLEKKPDETYDIKGSWIDRHTKHAIAAGKLMKDEDLTKKLLLDNKLAYATFKQLENDTKFLSEVNIMDYSLLLGVCYQKVKIERKRAIQDERIIDLDEDEEIKQDEDGNYIKSKQDYVNEILDADVVEGPGKYCIGIIDMLQEWDMNKKTERFIKSYVRCKDKDGISCVPPIQYKERFLDKMIEIGIGTRFRHESNATSIIRTEILGSLLEDIGK